MRGVPQTRRAAAGDERKRLVRTPAQRLGRWDEGELVGSAVDAAVEERVDDVLGALEDGIVKSREGLLARDGGTGRTLVGALVVELLEALARAAVARIRVDAEGDGVVAFVRLLRVAQEGRRLLGLGHRGPQVTEPRVLARRRVRLEFGSDRLGQVVLGDGPQAG